MPNSIDSTPLKSALETVRKSWADIATARERQAALETEVAEMLREINPSDEEAVGKCSLRKAQLDLLPGLIARIEKALAETQVPALLAAIGKAERALKERDATDRETFACEWLPLFEQHMPPRVDGVSGERREPARTFVLSSALCPRLADGDGNIGRGAFLSQRIDGKAEGHDRSAMERAEELIGIAERYRAYELGATTRALKGFV